MGRSLPVGMHPPGYTLAYPSPCTLQLEALPPPSPHERLGPSEAASMAGAVAAEAAAAQGAARAALAAAGARGGRLAAGG